ncbi:hypothetical protein GCM10011529_15820 [Polymorphobacter glacialis]|uniref:DUF885 domain-containing protein n=1 Tax=Sandarakinorhabdus glacialis TaxID=1614636 RepID=A0A916ZRB2_9SPHN|nr:DUF885 family protein [Polymorphobacter glacialis]GGE10285.1 hypothetical protein GCM10011529_15820 [Polymorphobacter glacialis]
MARRVLGLVAVLLASAVPGLPVQAAPMAATAMPANYPVLVKLFADWRRTVLPPVADGKPDYSPAAMAKLGSDLKAFRARLAAIDRTGWAVTANNDYRLVEAELNGLDFDLRVLTPWARDPTFYANVFADWSDVPAHEGPYAHPNIDLYAFKYPLNAADEARLTTLIAAIPANLAAAKVNLAGSNARDLWTYGGRAFAEQSDTLEKLGAGTLVMRTLDGARPAPITGAGPKLVKAIADARAATDDFAAWVAAEAPKKTGAVGLGKEHYNWYVKNVELLPYDWDAQVALLRRELDRSIAALRLEEVRNRDLPPIVPLTDPAAYARLVKAKQARFSQFLADTGLIPDAPWSRKAIADQAIEYEAPEKRNFFTHVNAYDPLPLLSHFTHWIDLARMRAEPHASPIRRVSPLFTIYSNRSEGFATAFEEVAMQAGLYDDVPHGRELVWIMLANRAARGLASLYVQSNEMDLAQAGKFHAEWTPRGWSDAASPLVGFEQLLYARQPGYGPSYVTGKLELDRLLADVSHADEVAGRPFVMRDVMKRVMDAGIIPVALIGEEIIPAGK